MTGVRAFGANALLSGAANANTNATLVWGLGGDNSLSSYAYDFAIGTAAYPIAALGGRLIAPEVGAAVRPFDIPAAETTGSRIIYDVPIGPVRPIHKNSLSYVGDTHIYAVKGPDGSIWKYGESAQGLNRDGFSLRGEMQARKLRQDTGEFYRSEILQTLPDVTP